MDKTRKPFVGILFKCCNVYSRIYINKTRMAYVGYCPRCYKKAEIRISKDGTDSRFFAAQ